MSDLDDMGLSCADMAAILSAPTKMAAILSAPTKMTGSQRTRATILAYLRGSSAVGPVNPFAVAEIAIKEASE